MTTTVLRCKIFNYFLHIGSADTFKIKVRYNPLFQKGRNCFGAFVFNAIWKFCTNTGNKLLKVLDISVLSSMFSPFKVKNAGKSFLSLHLLKISFIVDQVCRIFDLFSLNWSAKYCIFACLTRFLRFYYTILNLHWICHEGQFRHLGLLV